MISSEIRRFIDEARAAFPKLEIQLFKDLRGLFVAVAGTDCHPFRQKVRIPNPKNMRVMFFPSAKSVGYTHMIGNPYNTVTTDEDTTL